MMQRFVTMALATAVALAMGVLGVACGGGGGSGSLTLEGYFQRLETLSSQLDKNGRALDSRVQATQNVDDAKGIFNEYVDVLDGFVADLEKIDPPPEAQQAHGQAIAKGHAFAAEFQKAADQAQGAKTFDQVFAGTQVASFTAASDAFTQTCLTLQGIADDNEITVDLGCGQ